MERILVGIGPHTRNLWAAAHALGLARRLQARVIFLLVEEPGEGDGSRRRRLEGLIEQARSQGLAVEYYRGQGDYVEELVRLVEEHRVTLLVLDQPSARRGGAGEGASLIDNIRHRVDCRIEVVQETGRGPAGSA